ncbi:response regulator [Sorangium sp. So ce1036]|uniref:response regulator n=1 Tax=Sorangium sp. So ce1036 TaxID=3133328 RepID=UPI003F0B1833
MRPPQSPALVLIADDNPLNIEVLCGALSDEGLNLAMAGDGEEVLEVVGREEPDLILLDALMPNLDGFETCKRHRLGRSVPYAALAQAFSGLLNNLTASLRCSARRRRSRPPTRASSWRSSGAPRSCAPPRRQRTPPTRRRAPSWPT